MSEEFLIDDPAEGVRRITFNRPSVLNAFTMAMFTEFLEILDTIKRDASVRVVVLTGAGRGFCAGADTNRPVPADWVPADVGATYRNLYTMDRLNLIPSAIRAMPQPVIAAVNGPTAGIGYPIVLACDLAVAAHSAKFINAIHNTGSGVELGLSYMLPRAVGYQRAAEILLTMRPVLAEEAERIGLVLKSVPDDQLMDTVLELAKSMMANTPVGIWLTKQALWNNASVGSLSQAAAIETMVGIVAKTTADADEKRAAYREKRAPKFNMK